MWPRSVQSTIPSPPPPHASTISRLGGGACSDGGRWLASLVGRRPLWFRGRASVAWCYAVSWVPRTTVAWLESTPPLPWATATCAPETWRSPHSPRSWRDGLDDGVQAVHAGVGVRQPAAVGVERETRRPARCGRTRTNGAALALGAEAEVLEEQDRGDREGVVELRDVDVGRGDARLGEGAARRTGRPPSSSGRHAGDVAVAVRLAGAEHEDRGRAQRSPRARRR